MAHYQIYGDYGYQGETLLEEFDNLSDAIMWAEGYIEQGDFGGYSVIEVASFTADGEYITHWTASEEDADPEFDDYWDDDNALEEDF